MTEPRAVHFLDQSIEVLFDVPPIREKTPDCPNGFIWESKTYRVIELLSSWSDFARRGKMARNTPAQNRRCWVRPAHAEVASTRGSLNVGRFFFCVRVDTNQIFDLFYDRARKCFDYRNGDWVV